MRQLYHAHYAEHELLVENTWIAGIKLYVDNRLIDVSYTPFVLQEETLLRTRLGDGASGPEVEVKVRSGLMDVHVRILVDGGELTVQTGLKHRARRLETPSGSA